MDGVKIATLFLDDELSDCFDLCILMYAKKFADSLVLELVRDPNCCNERKHDWDEMSKKYPEHEQLLEQRFWQLGMFIPEATGFLYLFAKYVIPLPANI